MRLICTIFPNNSDENPHELSYYLTSQGIENEYEEFEKEGYRIWIYDEDQVERALFLYEEYKKNPSDPRYKAHYEHAKRVQEEKTLPLNKSEELPQRRGIFAPASFGPISIIILISVIGLFIWAQLQRETILPPKISGIVQAPILAPIERLLLYDYPEYFVLRDKLFSIYTPEDIEQKKEPPKAAIRIIKELRQMPVWMGIYDRIVDHLKNRNNPIAYHGPLFQNIADGEVWRLFTPTLLHFDLLHIFFNVLWFVLLGNQIEHRIGKLRYILLILISGILANTAQYFMSGPFFMGLSGVVVAMAGFIFARQQIAPWEGYLLHRFTLIFLAIFVVGMFVLQTIFFFLQVFGNFEIGIGIANTAHLVGGAAGYLIGRMRFFALKH